MKILKIIENKCLSENTKNNQNNKIRLNNKTTSIKSIKRYILFLIISLTSITFSVNTNAEIYISQILYNPFLTESGGEAVELYNSGNDDVNISGYTIRTASYEKDATLPNKAIIPAKGYYLIADSSWSEKKDDITMPDADHEEAITMLNSNSGIALLNRENIIVDKVGWGDKTKINPDLFSIEPANNTQKGYSLKRISFTGNNAIDFIESIPLFTNSKGETKALNAAGININLFVKDINNEIKNISINYDFENKIILNPGKERILNITFIVENTQNVDESYIFFEDIEYNTKIYKTDEKNNYYYSEIPLPYYLLAKNYTATIKIRKQETIYEKNITFIILPLLSIDFDLSYINCTISHSKECILIGDLDFSTKDKPTIKNTGNTQINFKVYGANFTGGKNPIDVSNIKFSFDIGNMIWSISNNPILYNVSFQPGANSMLPLSIKITMPQNISEGNYKSRIVFIGVNNE